MAKTLSPGAPSGDDAPAGDGPHLPRQLALPVLALIGICTGIEVVLDGADHRLWGSVLWRPLSYQYGGFWAGLMRGKWLANFPGQTGTMFLTHSFLHAGASHLIGNMAALWVLAGMIGDRIGRAGFLALWTLSVLAGALVFGLLGPASQPMVGTSGALFGLAGLLVVLEARATRAEGRGRLAVAGQVLLWLAGLALLNLVTWWMQAGILAWQAHLGGFLAGLVWGLAGGLVGLAQRFSNTRS